MKFFRRVLDPILGGGPFVLNQQAGDLLENFFISTVVSILVIRLYIGIFAATPVTTQLTMRLAPSPQNVVDLHFAHVLWGGLLMLVALVLALSFLGRFTRELAAVLGGVGFGAFIDELGKFITLNNNYFFQPTIALIYLLLVLLFIVIRTFQRPRQLSRRDTLANALEVTKFSLVGDARPEDRARALALLSHYPPQDPDIAMVQQVLHRMEETPAPKPHFLGRHKELFNRTAQRLVNSRWFITAMVIFFVVQSLASLYETLAAIEWTGAPAAWLAGIVLALLVLYALRHRSPSLQTIASIGIISSAVVASLVILLYQQEPPRNLGALLYPMMPEIEAGTGFPSRVFNMLGVLQVVSPIISNVLVAIGILFIWHSRLTAYRLFHHAVLVSILLTQVFIFHEDQLMGVLGLVPNLVILAIIRYLIRREESAREAGAGAGADRPASVAGPVGRG